MEGEARSLKEKVEKNGKNRAVNGRKSRAKGEEIVRNRKMEFARKIEGEEDLQDP